MNNPYVTGPPVHGDSFVGRDDIVNELRELWALRQQPHSVVLFGHRRMGKTSILRNVGDYLSPNVHIAYLDAAGVGGLAAGAAGLLIALSDRIAQVTGISSPTEADFLGLPYASLMRYLDEVDGALGEHGRLIIALDEFEHLEYLIAHGLLKAGFLDALRSLSQRSPRLALALAGTHTLDEMSGVYAHPFFSSFEGVRVGFLALEAVNQLLTQPAGHSLRYS
jgi:hypothetical protein